MVTPAQGKFELLMQGIEKFLASEGFHRSGKGFINSMPDGKVRWNIESQRTRYTTSEWTKFTFSVYAEWKHRQLRSEDWEPKSTWYGIVGNRIGYLMPKKEDTWWELDAGTSIDFLSDQINGVMSACVLPFLRQFPTEQAIINHLRALPLNNYYQGLTILELDVMEKKSKSEIEESAKRARKLASGWWTWWRYPVKSARVEADIQRILKAGGQIT